MKTEAETMRELAELAKKSGIGLVFGRDGEYWVARWRNGRRVAWCGTLAEVRRVARGLSAVR